MSLNLTHLKYFFDSVRLGGVTASAKQNYVTQSAISQGIRKLEHYFQKSLLTHRRNQIKLTLEGQHLYENSKHLFHYVDEINATFQKKDGIYTGTLKFACYYSFAVSFLPKVLARFQELAPQVNLQFYTGRMELVRGWLKEGKVEIGVLTDNQDFSPYESELFYKGFFNVYESIYRPLNEPINRCIFSEPGVEVISLKKSYLQNYGKELIKHMDINSWEVIVNLVMTNVGVGLLPDYLAKVNYRSPLLRISNLKYDPMPYQLFIVYPKGEELSKNASLFLKCMKDEGRIIT